MIYICLFFLFLFSKEGIVINEDFLLTVAFALAIAVITFNINSYYVNFYTNTTNNLVNEIVSVFIKKQNVIDQKMNIIKKLDLIEIHNMVNLVNFYDKLIKVSTIRIKKIVRRLLINIFWSKLRYFSLRCCRRTFSKKIIRYK